MYQAFYDGGLLYDPRDHRTAIRETELHLAVNEPGEFSFVMDPGHPVEGLLRKMSGLVEVRDDGVTIYRGRIVRDSLDFNLSRTIETEGVLAALNDSVVEPFDFPAGFEDDPEYQEAAETGNVVEFFLGWLLGVHNAAVTTEQQIQLGTVTVSDPNNYFSRSSSGYETTWATITGKLLNSSLGGYLLVRYETDGTYLDYYAELPLTNTEEVRYAGNLLDLVSDVDATEIFSVILPVGADGLTIEALPDGDLTPDLVKAGKTIYSRAGVAAYGKICKVQTWEDVTVAANLQTKARAALAAAGMQQTVTVSAVDLAYAGEGTFRVGRKTVIASEPHGFSAVYPLTELDIDLLDPAATEITLGEAILTGTDRNAAQAAASERAVEGARMEMNRRLSEVMETTSEQITEAVQTSQAIILSALDSYVQTGDFETFRQEVSTQLALTAGQIEISFRTATEQINDVNGDLQRIYNERLKYIRFEDGNIILGVEGNEIVLTIENDRVSFTQGGQEVAYFNDHRLYVTDGEFTVSAQIGDFAFVPGANGNLSFKKVR